MELRILTGNIKQIQPLLSKDLQDKLNYQAGDTTLVMETEEQKEVGREVFNSLLTNGWRGYSVKDGKTEKQVKEFETDLDTIVMFGPIAGG